MKCEVVTVSNREPTQSYYIFRQFKESLRRFAMPVTILGWQEPWAGLMTKPRRLRQWLRDRRYSSDRLIVCDAWDIVFAEHPHGMIDFYESHFGPDKVVFNAERNCFPRGDLADRFPDPGTPWRYLNSGFMVGTPENILKIIDSMGIDHIPDDHRQPDGSWYNPNDQEHYTLAYLEQPVPMVLDTQCHLCQSLSGCEPYEFDFSTRPFKNLVTGSAPRVFHFNGSAKQVLMGIVLQNLNL